jgi:uncharacterized membrane protein YraQ (UPF0718 family)
MEGLIIALTKFADYIVYNQLGLELGSTFASALHYFIIGFIEISVLVVLVTYIMGFISSYLPMEKIRLFLEKHKASGLGNLLASLLGAITPFCSCSSIPLFVGMLQARIPLGITLSFLITSPLVNEIAIALFWVSFGWKVTLIYILTGVLLGVMGGIVLEKMGMDKYVADWIKNLNQVNTQLEETYLNLKDRLKMIQNEASITLRRLLPYIAIGLAIGSFIHGYVPESFFQNHLSKENILAVPIAVLSAIPLYTDAVGVLPIVTTLVAKGVPLGTAIAFMMGAIGLSLPEALLLKKVMKMRLIIAFFAILGLGMILSGYLFNLMF